MSDYYSKESRKEWYRTDSNKPDIQQLSFGALQRIAEATEKMAASYDNLRADRDYWERRCREESESGHRMALRIRALQGVITRQRNAAAMRKESE